MNYLFDTRVLFCSHVLHFWRIPVKLQLFGRLILQS